MLNVYKIDVDFLPGTNLDDAVEDAIFLAAYTESKVMFNFNGVNLYVTCDSDADEIKTVYKYLLLK